MNEYSIAFCGNLTVYAQSEQEARAQFGNVPYLLRDWAEIDTVQLQARDLSEEALSL